MTTDVRTRWVPGVADRTTILLAAIDSGLIVGLLLFGQQHHGLSPIAEPVASLETVVPFLIGWIVVSLLTAVYAREVTASVARTARTTGIAWIAAANVGLIVRSSPLFDGSAIWPFNLVVTATGLAVLVCWRVGFAAYTGRSPAASKSA